MAQPSAAFPAGEISLIHEGILQIKMQSQETAIKLLRQPNPIDPKNVSSLQEYYRKRVDLCDQVIIKLPFLRNLRREALAHAG